MKLFQFVLKRILLSIPVILGTVILTFLISHVVVPNPARAWAGTRASQQTVDAIAARYHLNAPLYVQLYYYLDQLLHGNLGTSPVTGQSILGNIQSYLPATIELSVYAILIVIAIGIPLGVISATHKEKPTDHGLRLLSLTGASSPPFFVALLLQLVGFYYLRIFPISGRISQSINPPYTITGFFTIDSLLEGNLAAFESSVVHLVLPAFTLAFLSLGYVVRLVRSNMLDVLNNDYVRTAKAKGLSETVVVYKHALRNALTATVTVVGYIFAFMLAGSVVVEYIFSWPGIGHYIANAVLTLDFPAIMGTTFIYAIIVVAINIIVDILYAVLDPRVKY